MKTKDALPAHYDLLGLLTAQKMLSASPKLRKNMVPAAEICWPHVWRVRLTLKETKSKLPLLAKVGDSASVGRTCL